MRAIAFGDGLELTDRADALILRARLPVIPAADVALEGVKSGRYNGGIPASSGRKATFATPTGSGLSRMRTWSGSGWWTSPSYEANTIEVRRRIGRVRSSIPKGRKMDCRCADGCTEALIEPAATIDISETAIAIRRGYAEALASRSKGTMRVLVDDDGIHLDLDLPDTTYARDLLEAADNVPLIVRPVVDFSASEWVKDGALASFSRLAAPAFVVGFSDMSQGHQEAVTSNRRRRRTWL